MLTGRCGQVLGRVQGHRHRSERAGVAAVAAERPAVRAAVATVRGGAGGAGGAVAAARRHAGDGHAAVT